MSKIDSIISGDNGNIIGQGLSPADKHNKKIY
jgi:hypothetical protein